MKLCPKCGASYDDHQFFCVDCHTKLSDKLSPAEEQQRNDDISEKVETAYDKADPLYVGRLHKIFGTLSLLGIAGSVLLMIFDIIAPSAVPYLWSIIACFSIAAIEALWPRVIWFFVRLQLIFLIEGANDAVPSGLYRTLRKISVVYGTILGLTALVLTYFTFQYPPVEQYIADIAATENMAADSSLDDYILVNREKWGDILQAKDHTVKIFLSALEDADSMGLEERLMMRAIITISRRHDMVLVDYADKDAFLTDYYAASYG